MIKKTLKEIEIMSQGKGLKEEYENILIEGVSTDSRTIKKNQLFVPLIGEFFNAHEFIENAIENGAVASLWSKNETIPDIDFPFILVEDTLVALQQLAKNYRENLNIKIVGITGSNGKTSTKDILEALLSTQYKTQKTMGNLNNHIGVPLSILSLEEDTEIAVIEMGTGDFGEMALLSSIVQPNVAMITNIGDAHLEWFITLENVAIEKLDIINDLDSKGLFVYLGDDPILKEKIKDLKIEQNILKYGTGENNDYICELISLEENGLYFKLKSPIEKEFFLPLLGEHNIYNATGAILVARYFGIPIENIQYGLDHIDQTGSRNELIKANGFSILNDSYKSNPNSLRAALDTLYNMKQFSQKIVVLGDMQGLGEKEIEMHEEIGREIDPSEIEYIITIGPLSKSLAKASKENFSENNVISCDTNEEVMESLKKIIEPNAVILVKASRAFELENIVERLQKEVKLTNVQKD
ncbi:MAG: UDP-N-acetylmuramoyl-tripeptide--D-alanyl-D-alanine ligase [Tissierellia bacterium]|nr:UDP-N-acetylmuramoyl-tripeptide--D-alanyl-D-alanine ligase [Tissierellia bacterium]